MKAKLNANEVITTLMFDYIVTYFLSYLVYGPLMDPLGHGFPSPVWFPNPCFSPS
jgi:simple sugar transport system permease protein